jgi:hypothetical protein
MLTMADVSQQFPSMAGGSLDMKESISIYCHAHCSDDSTTCSTTDETRLSVSTSSETDSNGVPEHMSPQELMSFQQMLPQEPRTTVVIKNLVPQCTREVLVGFLDAMGFEGTYDMVYMPTCFDTLESHQFAFVDFLSEEIAMQFEKHLHGVALKRFFGDQLCEIAWSDCQGLQANIRNYRNSPVMHTSVPAACKPQLFVDGLPVPFPAPTKRISKPRRNRRTR